MAKEVSPLQHAMRLLAARDHGREELGRKLARKGFEVSAIEGTLTRLEEMGFLDDNALVDREVARLISDGRGPRLVRQRLGARGLPIPRVERRLSEAEDAGQVDEACRAALQKKFPTWPAAGEDTFESAPFDEKAWSRAARFLAGRGFRESTIRRTLVRQPSGLRS